MTQSSNTATTLDKLDDGRMDDGLVSWLVTISIGGVALIMRLWNLSYLSLIHI